MLSSKCSSRLLSLLNQALHNCKEEERLLEEQLRRCCKLLADWKTDSCDTLNPEHPASEPLESPPSAEEVQEVELLNKALEKACKVRGTSRTEMPKDPPAIQRAPPPSLTTKEKTSKPLSKPSSTGAKPVTYHLKAPYKTMPEKRRVREVVRAASVNKTALSNHSKPIPSEKGKDRLPGHTTDWAPPKPTSPPSAAPDGEASPQTEEKQRKALTLQDKGPSLKLPIDYQQQYMRNSRLWEKYYEIQSRLPASRPSFLQKLQTTFIAESPELSSSEIAERAARLQSAIQSLERRIAAASDCRESGPPHWQQYRALLMLEALQDEVVKSHSELQKLQQVTEQYKRWSEKLSINPVYTEGVICPSAQHSAPPLLTYSHPRELRDLTACRLRALELQQKIHLQKVQSEELLPEADSQCRGPLLLLRALYTQLCEGGESFPVLLQDDS